MSFLPHTMACGNSSAESACPPFTLRKADEQERWSSERAKERKSSMNTPARTDRARDTLLHTFAADMTEGTYPIALEYFARRPRSRNLEDRHRTVRKRGTEMLRSSGASLVDSIAFGRPFIANPDLPERFSVGAALKEVDWPTVYASGPEGTPIIPR
jgi:2,4-dienoyl-CoA reductase-like NADH-dependent reductase (Old Yellow Enzyme family)